MNDEPSLTVPAAWCCVSAPIRRAAIVFAERVGGRKEWRTLASEEDDKGARRTSRHVKGRRSILKIRCERQFDSSPCGRPTCRRLAPRVPAGTTSDAGGLRWRGFEDYSASLKEERLLGRQKEKKGKKTGARPRPPSWGPRIGH